MSISTSPIKGFLLGAAASVLAALPALAGDITIGDAYARASTKMAKSGAIFMHIHNDGAEDDKLIAAQTDAARKTELHTHIMGDDGVMKMRMVEGGFTIPADGVHMLERGGDHVMLMGLTQSLAQGDVVNLTLTFNNAGDIELEVPVDLERKAGHEAGHKHKAGHDHKMEHGDHSND